MTKLSAPILGIFYICNPKNTTVTLNFVKVPEKTQKMSCYYDHDLRRISADSGVAPGGGDLC